MKMAQTQRIDLRPLGSDQESKLSDSINESKDSEPDSDDDDLVPFDLPEEKPFSKVLLYTFLIFAFTVLWLMDCCSSKFLRWSF